MESEKRIPELSGRVRGVVHVATLTGTQGQHEVLKAFQETIAVQLHPAVRVLPWTTASALGFPTLKIEAQAGCTQAGG